MSAFDQQFDEAALDRALADKGFRHFIPMAWHLVCPGNEFVPSWHIDAIAEHLEACLSRDIKRLVINVPPGSTKSLTACVLFPAWAWTQQPVGDGYGAAERFIFGSYDEALARRDSLACRNLMESQWFQERWGKRFEFDRTKEFTGDVYYNKKGGFRKIVTVGGSVVGFHATMHVIDDPVKPLDIGRSVAVAKTAINTANIWYDETMSTRAVDLSKLVRIVIMQRLHHADLAGKCVDTGEYTHLMLPMEFEPKRKCFIEVTGFEDPRTEYGELLCEGRYDREAVEQEKRDLGPRGAQAQMQQNPTPDEGAVFDRSKAQYYIKPPKHFTKLIQSWDMNFKETDDGSFVVGQVWGRKDADLYLLDMFRERCGFSASKRAVRAMTKKWPRAYKKLVEDKANGPAIVDDLKDEIAGFELVNPQGGKVSRANAAEAYWDGGNIYLPDASIAPWVTQAVDEICGFDAYPTDDIVDAMSQAIVYLSGSKLLRLKKAMGNVLSRRS